MKLSAHTVPGIGCRIMPLNLPGGSTLQWHFSFVMIWVCFKFYPLQNVTALHLIQHPDFYCWISTIPVPAPSSGITLSSTCDIGRCRQSLDFPNWTLNFVEVNINCIHATAGTLQHQSALFQLITRYIKYDTTSLHAVKNWRVFKLV